MKRIIIYIFIAIAVFFIGLINETDTVFFSEKPKQLGTTYAQEVWISALEWCESRGIPSAVNEKDRDGTASYYSFQFKPGTFRSLGEIYSIIPADISQPVLKDMLKDTEVQKDIVRGMVKDMDNVDWHQQFPVCIQNIGLPPKY